jgi:hypothetical protein
MLPMFAFFWTYSKEKTKEKGKKRDQHKQDQPKLTL